MFKEIVNSVLDKHEQIKENVILIDMVDQVRYNAAYTDVERAIGRLLVMQKQLEHKLNEACSNELDEP